MLSQQHNNNLQHLESYAATSIQTRNVEKCVATCFFPAPAPVSGPWSLHPWVSSSAASSLSCFGPQGGPCSWRDEICCLDFQLDKSYIYIYSHSFTRAYLELFSWYLQQKNIYFIVHLFVWFTHYHTSTVQFNSCFLAVPQLPPGYTVTPHPKTARLPSLQSKVVFVDELGLCCSRKILHFFHWDVVLPHNHMETLE